jgi:AcrR family transcriptional regulator
MSRKNLSDERRRELVAVIAAAFAELGYRRATTALLAERCGVQETTLYRLWPDKRAMFVAAIEYVGSNSEDIWRQAMAAGDNSRSAAQRVLEYESAHLGEFGLYRILFAGWSETDDEQIAAALRGVYARFLRFIRERVAEHRAAVSPPELPAADLTAWALVGLATAANLGRELGLLGDRKRRQLLAEVGAQRLG